MKKTMSLQQTTADGELDHPLGHFDFEVSSSPRRTNNNNNNNKHNKVEESDDDLFTVPDVEEEEPNSTMISGDKISDTQHHSEFPACKRRRGRNPADKEYRRLKRLLRNRVSAQQARERKKIYVNELESRAKELQDHNAQLEEKISTLMNENAMLRKVLMNTRPKVDNSVDTK